MRLDKSDNYERLRSMVDHPAGRHASCRPHVPSGRHRTERIATPLDVMQDHRGFRAAEFVLGVIATVGVATLVVIILHQAFLAVMGLW